MSKTQKTKTTKARTRTTSQTPIDPPAGLVAAFAIVNQDGSTPIAALHTARKVYPHALRMIDLLHGRLDVEGEHQDLSIEKVFEDIVRDEYAETWKVEGKDPATNAGLIGDEAFHVGYAVCWLLMNSINGGSR